MHTVSHTAAVLFGSVCGLIGGQLVGKGLYDTRQAVAGIVAYVFHQLGRCPLCDRLQFVYGGLCDLAGSVDGFGFFTEAHGC